MLFLVLSVAGDRFLIETDRVIEVLALVYWKAVPDAPPGVVGVMNYHGTAIPLIDLSLLVLGHPTEPRMTTRIVLVDTAGEADAEASPDTPPRIGLIAERVIGTGRHDPTAFVEPDALVSTVPYLGPFLTDDGGILQRVEIARVLAGAVRRRLVAAASPALGDPSGDAASPRPTPGPGREM